MLTRLLALPVLAANVSSGARRLGRQIRSTRALLLGARAALLVTVCALIWVGFGVQHYYGATVRLIGVNSGPAIIATSKMRTWLADASALAIDAGLSDGAKRELFLHQYAEAMDQVHGSLISAALNITYGQEEREPLYQLMSALADYERKIGMARAAKGPLVIEHLQEAALTLQERVLPEVAELETVNVRNLRNAYQRHRASGQQQSVALLSSGALILSLIVVVQWLLLRRFRRILNGPLLAAAAVVAGYLLLAINLTQATDQALEAASHDSFERVHALIGIKSAAFDARIAEGLLLLTRGSGAGEAAFARMSSALPAAEPTWSNYVSLHERVLALHATGHREEAIALHIGPEPGESNWAFDQFVAALEQRIFSQQNDFDAAITRAAQRLYYFPWLLAATALLMVVLIVLALRPRLAEFRF